MTAQLGKVASKLKNIELGLGSQLAVYIPCDVQHSPQHQAIMAM